MNTRRVRLPCKKRLFSVKDTRQNRVKETELKHEPVGTTDHFSLRKMSERTDSRPKNF